jgi:hypothetical protein
MSTHPSIVIRAKALLWLSVSGLLKDERKSADGEILLLNQRVERDLQRFVDGAMRKQIEENKRDLLLWMMTYEIVQVKKFSRPLQSRTRQMFGDDTVDRLLGFLDALKSNEVDEVVYEKVCATRARLKSVMLDAFESEVSKIQERVAEEMN